MTSRGAHPVRALRTVVAPFVAIALVLADCGGDDEETGAATAEETAEETGGESAEPTAEPTAEETGGESAEPTAEETGGGETGSETGGATGEAPVTPGRTPLPTFSSSAIRRDRDKGLWCRMRPRPHSGSQPSEG